MADNFNLRSFLSENKLTKNAQLLKEGSDYGYEAVIDAIADHFEEGTPEYDQVLAAVEDAFHSNEVDTSDFSHDPSAPGQVVLDIAAGLGLAEAKKEVAEEKEAIQETLTAKERRLVEMVQNALGEEENVDYTMGRHDDPNQLPNPAPEFTIPEGDEMADETVIPEYNTIDELMNSIDHGTNKVAEEHKMEQMKKIAEALRMKAKKMEESEHAAHISPKDLKQLATDAAKLEKAAEKLKAAFDKKFNKKEKAATAPKKEKVEALQEGTFNLRKFLVENKLTAGSRMLNENTEISPEVESEIRRTIEISIPEDIEQTSDHMGEGITQALENDGIELPGGMFNNNMHNALLTLSTEFHSGQLPMEAAVQKAISIAMNPANYR